MFLCSPALPEASFPSSAEKVTPVSRRGQRRGRTPTLRSPSLHPQVSRAPCVCVTVMTATGSLGCLVYDLSYHGLCHPLDPPGQESSDQPLGFTLVPGVGNSTSLCFDFPI